MNITRTSPFQSGHDLTALQRRVGGFTLIEVLIVLVVAAILATMAAPSLTSIIATQRAKSVATDLHLSLTVARSEAASRNASVTVAANSGAWQNGWQIYPTATPANVIQNYAATRGATIDSGGVTSVIYQRSGRIQGAATFVITASSVGSTASRCVSVDLSGRPYVKAGTSC